MVDDTHDLMSSSWPRACFPDGTMPGGHSDSLLLFFILCIYIKIHVVCGTGALTAFGRNRSPVRYHCTTFFSLIYLSYLANILSSSHDRVLRIFFVLSFPDLVHSLTKEQYLGR